MNDSALRSEVLRKAAHIHRLYKEGLIEGPPHQEVNPGLDKASRENYLYFTMAVCLNFQRQSATLWQSALKTYEDPTTRYVFDPLKVMGTDINILREHLLKHKLALQPNKHIEIWRRLSATFAQHFENDPRRFFARYDWDVPAIIRALQVEEKAKFPYLSGLKLSNYWLFILSCYTDAPFRNLHRLSIIPDTHIVQSSIRLGVVPAGATPQQVEVAWQPLLEESGLPPTDMHSALWRWSRNNFKPEV